MSNIYLGADRLKDVKFSPVRVVLQRARQIENEGRKVVNFGLGEPDFDTPKEIINATIDALNENFTHYASNRGNLLLRKAISKKLLDEENLTYDAENEILMTIGVAEGINDAISAFINSGDEVIIFTPGYMNYENCIKMAGGKTIAIPLRKENGFQIDINELSDNITTKTKMIVINNPSNPTGIVYNKEILEQVCKIACEFNLLVLSDEIYDQITYKNVKFHSVANFNGMKERTILLKGFSKTYAMTGWRLGYIAADEKLIPHMLKVHQYTTTCVPTFIQEGVSRVMLSEECKDSVKKMVKAFEIKRDILIDGLKTIEKLSFIESMGAFYVLVDVKDTHLTGEEFARMLLEEKGVAVVPGVGFGKECTDFIRISFATSEEDIKLGLAKIKEFVDSL